MRQRGIHGLIIPRLSDKIVRDIVENFRGDDREDVDGHLRTKTSRITLIGSYHMRF